MTEQQTINKIPTVLGIGRISGEGATNIIPENVYISGTFRTFDEKWRSEGISLIRSVSAETALEFGVKIDVNIAEGYPVLFNDENLTSKAIGFSEELLGKNKIETYDIRMSSDDFSFYSALAPSLYYRVGIRKKILKCLNYIHLILILMRMVWRQELQILVGSHIIFCYRKFTLGRSEKTISVLFSFVLLRVSFVILCG